MRKNVNKFLSSALAVSLMVSTLFSPSIPAYAKDDDVVTTEIVETTEEFSETVEETTEITEETTVETTEITEDTTEDTTEDITDTTEDIEETTEDPNADTALAASYIPSNPTAVKNRQSGSYTGWAFAICAAAEANLQKKGYATSPDLSEYQLMYFIGNSQVDDPLGLTTGDSYTVSDMYKTRAKSTTSVPNKQIEFAIRKMAGWVGVVNETDAPYNTSKTALDDSLCYTKDSYHLANVKKVPCTDRDAVKQAIVDYGAVVTSIYMIEAEEDTTYYSANPKTSSSRVGYYYSGTTAAPTTEITIVGWDDTYSKSKLTGAATPSSDGAWLCKYSRGTSWSGDGYFWVSYEDKAFKLTKNRAYAFDFEKASKYTSNYHYDGGVYDSTLSIYWESVIFTNNTDSPIDVKAVGLYAPVDGLSCDISIYNNVQYYPTRNGTQETSTTGSFEYAGYYTVELPSAVTVSPGAQYSVVVHYSTKVSSLFDSTPTTQDSTYTCTSATQTYRTYYYASSSQPSTTGWTDGNKKTYDSRIKAYTTEASSSSIVKVSSITLDKTSLSLNKGDTYSLTATVAPSNATTKTVEYTSSNTSVATVDSSGKITAVAGGTATITCTAKDGSGVSATCAVTVSDKILVTKITLEDSQLNLSVGDEYSMQATITPSNADNSDVTWTSSNTSVVTVTGQVINGKKYGVITAVGAGTATITCAATDGSGKTASCGVTVKAPVTKITNLSLSPGETEMSVGGVVQLKATITPSNATNQTLEWSSYNDNIATVDSNGKVTGVAEGVTLIEAATTDGSNIDATAIITVAKETIYITSITLNKTTIDLPIGDTFTLEAKVLPENATDKQLDFSSSNTNVATVDSLTGEIKGISDGTAIISCKSTDGSNIIKKCTVNVYDNTVFVDSVELDIHSKDKMVIGDTYTLNATVLPEDASNKTLEWTSSDESVAIVNDAGKVTAKGEGTVVITATSTDGTNKSDSCTFTIVKPAVLATSVSLSKTLLTMYTDKTFILTATVLPEDADDKTVTWSSSDESIVSVKEGMLTAHAPGTATITCKANGGSNVKATCSVTVKRFVSSITINPSKKVAKLGENFALEATVLPADATKKTVTWSSSNTSVATVTSDGVVAAIGTGTATITATASDGSNVSGSCLVEVKKYVNQVIFDTTSKELHTGEEFKIQATVLPADASDTSLTWTSSNTAVATVSQSGVVAAVGVGTADITATSNDGTNISATCKISVKQYVTSIQLNETNKNIYTGESFKLTATVLPANASDPNIEWSSSDSEKAVVAADGTVTALAEGTVTITASATDGSNCSASCNVVITKKIIKAESIKLSDTNITLETGKTTTVTATVLPLDANDQTVSWSSSDTSVATVSSTGTITAVKAGNAVITCTANGGDNVTAICAVTVKDPVVLVNSITLSKTNAELETGDTYELKATVLPSTATNKSVSWTTSDETKAIVSTNGVVTALAEGTVEIKCMANDGSGISASCTFNITDPVVLVTSISLSSTTLTLDKGSEVTLLANVLPENADNKSVSWSTSNSSVATVTSDGCVKAVSAGTATIKCQANDGSGVYASCTVKVNEPVVSDIKVTSITLGASSLQLNIYEEYTLTYSVLPENATNKSVSITSSNTDVATVSASGVIAAKNAGKTIITVSANDGSGKSASCEVTVVKQAVKVTKISLNTTYENLEVGDTFTLEATVLPSDADDKSITWSSTNTSVAIVSNKGVVTVVGAGYTSITATSNDGSNVSASCSINATKPDVKVSSVTLDKTDETLTVGATTTITATVLPENASDKTLKWSSSNTSVATVDSNSGVVTAKGEGETIITCETTDGTNLRATCHISVTTNRIYVTNINLDKTSAEVDEGATLQINATVMPSNATNTSYSVTSDNTDVAVVSSNGLVTAKKAGTAVITFTANDGSGVTAACTVKVKSSLTLVESITLNTTSSTLLVGAKLALTATVLPENATNKELDIVSLDSSVAKVDSNGNVTAVGVGTTNIVFTAKDGSGVTKKCFIKVCNDISTAKVKFTATSFAYNVSGNTPAPIVTFNGTVLKKNTDYTVKYANNVNPGTATVTVTGIGKYRGTVKGYFKITPPATKFTSVLNGSRYIYLKWNKSTGARGYFIYRSDNGGSYKKIKTISSGSTLEYYDKNNLSNGSRYKYKIVACYSTSNMSAPSAYKEIYRVNKVVMTGVSNSAAKTITVKWKRIYATTGYQIRYATKSDFSDKKYVYVSGSSTLSKSIKNLVKGKKYYVSVRAVKKANGVYYYGAWSSPMTVTVKK